MYKNCSNHNEFYRSVMKTLSPKHQTWRPVKAWTPRWTFSFISANWQTLPWA